MAFLYLFFYFFSYSTLKWENSKRNKSDILGVVHFLLYSASSLDTLAHKCILWNLNPLQFYQQSLLCVFVYISLSFCCNYYYYFYYSRATNILLSLMLNFLLFSIFKRLFSSNEFCICISVCCCCCCSCIYLSHFDFMSTPSLSMDVYYTYL